MRKLFAVLVLMIILTVALCVILSNVEALPYEITPIPIIPAVVMAVTTITVAGIHLWSNRHDLWEREFRSDLSINILVMGKIIDSKVTGSSGTVVELRVEITNNSKHVCCIPAVYVRSRALYVQSISNISASTGRYDFDLLPECFPLTAPVNVARLPSSIIQLAPGETESFVRWDVVDRDFISKFPVIVSNVEAFGVAGDILGEQHYPRIKRGVLRNKWLEYARKAQNHNRILFSRWGYEVRDDMRIKKFDRYILDSSGQLDQLATEEFRVMLDGMVQWTRHITIDLRGAS